MAEYDAFIDRNAFHEDVFAKFSDPRSSEKWHSMMGHKNWRKVKFLR